MTFRRSISSSAAKTTRSDAVDRRRSPRIPTTRRHHGITAIRALSWVHLREKVFDEESLMSIRKPRAFHHRGRRGRREEQNKLVGSFVLLFSSECSESSVVIQLHGATALTAK